MDSPVRQQQKRNDYLRHKMFRKINRRRRAKRQQDIEAPVKELKKRLRQKRNFADGKDGDVITNTRGESYRIDPDLPMYNDDGTLNAVIDNVNIYSPRGYREAYERRVNNMLQHTENPKTGYAPGLKLTFPEFDLIPAGALVKAGIKKIPWTFRIPENPHMAYRRMGPLERDWLMEGNELSTRATNYLTEAEEEAARAASKKVGRFSLFKAGSEHGGRKQFAKGQPWKGNTVTHGEEQVLTIPGEGLDWVSGRHYRGPQGNSFGVGSVSFEEAPFGSHIDLLTKDGYSGVNPSLLEGSVIYSPFKIFGHNFGYKKLYPGYADGKDSGIYIKPQNRGKFTRLKKRTGHSTAWFKAHGTPAQKKMATFAQNAKKWHH